MPQEFKYIKTTPSENSTRRTHWSVNHKTALIIITQCFLEFTKCFYVDQPQKEGITLFI